MVYIVQTNEETLPEETYQRRVMLESLLKRSDKFYISFSPGILKQIYRIHPLLLPNSKTRTFPFITIKQPSSFCEKFDGKTYHFNKVSTGNSRKLTSNEAIVTLTTSMNANIHRLNSQRRGDQNFFYGLFIPSNNQPSKDEMGYIARTLIDEYCSTK